MHSMFGGLRHEGQSSVTEPTLYITPTKSDVALDYKARLIGLTAPARAGKDTVGTILRDYAAMQLVSFAEPIRKALRAMLGLTDEHFHGSLKEVPIDYLGKSPRQLMQTLGTEWGRGLVNDDIWLLLAKETYSKHIANNVGVVITDVRFENEASLIRASGGQIWHILRGDAPKVSKHPSEAGVAFQPALGDIQIDNNGSLAELKQKVIHAY